MVEADTVPSGVVFREFKSSVNVCCLTASLGRVSAKASLLGAHTELRPDSPQENLSVGVGPADPNPLHQARNSGRHPVLAPDPSFFPEYCAFARWETCWEVWSPGKCAVLWTAGKASNSTDTVTGTL